MKKYLIIVFMGLLCPFFCVHGVTLLMINEDLPSAITVYEQLSGKTVVMSYNLPEVKISLNTQGEMSKDETLKALRSAFAVNGIALVDVSNRVQKAVMLSESEQSPEEERISRVFEIKNGDAQTLQMLIMSTLRSQQGQGQMATAGQQQGQSVLNGLSLFADIRTNALVCRGSPKEIQEVERLVRDLDKVLPQVKIEVVICEVLLTEESTSGLAQLGFTISENNLLSFAGKGLGSSGISTPFEFSGVLKEFSLTALLGLAKKNDNVKFELTPSIITAHNKKAYVVVSEARPIITGSSSDNSNPNSRSSSVEYRDIGIRLDVLPLIGDSDIQLQIKQTVDRVSGTTIIDGNSQPIIGRREFDSFVTVKSGEIIVLSGFIQNEDIETGGVMSLLRLRSRSKETISRELIVFLRPTVQNQSSGEITAFPSNFTVDETPPTATVLPTAGAVGGMVVVEPENDMEMRKEIRRKNRRSPF